MALSRFNTRFAALFEQGRRIGWQARHGIDRGGLSGDLRPAGPAGLPADERLRLQRGHRVAVQRGLATARRPSLAGAAWADARRVPGHVRRSASSKASGWSVSAATPRTARRAMPRSGNSGRVRLAGAARAVAEPVSANLRPNGRRGLRAGAGLRLPRQRRCALRGYLGAASRLQWVGRHGLTASEYQKAFDQQFAAGFRLVSVSGYSDTGIARYAAIWHQDADRRMAGATWVWTARAISGLRRPRRARVPARSGVRLRRRLLSGLEPSAPIRRCAVRLLLA